MNFKTFSSSASIALKLALFIPFTAAFQLGSNEYDCENGCDLSPEINGPPVCGANGVTFFNECLAVCQEVDIEKIGACIQPRGDLEGAGDNGSTNPLITAGRITKEKLDRFKLEKFNFIGKIQFDVTPRSSSTEDGKQEDRVDASRGADRNRHSTVGIIRLTAEGDTYYSPMDEDAKEVMESRNRPIREDEHPSGLPMAANGTDTGDRMLRGAQEDERKLGIVGADTRYQISSTSSYPYRTIGELDRPSNPEGGCTATIISRTSAVTAAHCFMSNGVLNDRTRLAPGRYDNWWDWFGYQTSEPYGQWYPDYMSFYSNYLYGEDRSYDFAVITYHPQNGQFIGEKVGYMGFSYTSNSGSGLQKATVTGYPYDKTDGQMWTSGTCPGGFQAHIYSGNSRMTTHYCDSVGANSGSALLDLNNRRVYGVHVASYYISGDQASSNIGVVLSWPHYQNLENWSGRGNVGDIRVKYNNRCMDMNLNNKNAYIHDCHGGNNQKWIYNKNTREIKSSYNSQCLDYHTGNGNLYVHPCHGGSNQKWIADGGRLKSQYNQGKCIDMDLNHGSNLILWDCHWGSNQQFIVPDKFFN